LRRGSEQAKSSQKRCGKRGDNFQIHLDNDLTTQGKWNTGAYFA
jgi:hypothetical protein